MGTEEKVEDETTSLILDDILAVALVGSIAEGDIDDEALSY